MESKIIYFEDIGPQNTGITFKTVKERLKDSGINKIVVASTTGATARLACDCFNDAGIKLIVIPHQNDFRRDVNPYKILRSGTDRINKITGFACEKMKSLHVTLIKKGHPHKPDL